MYVNAIEHCHYCVETVLISLTKDVDFFSFSAERFLTSDPKTIGCFIFLVSLWVYTCELYRLLVLSASRRVLFLVLKILEKSNL